MKHIITILRILGILLILFFVGQLTGIVKFGKSDNVSIEEPNKDPNEEKIKKQFSVWDGSHYNLVKYVKERLNDDNSFRHVNTTAKILGDNVLVKMEYRAANTFGAIVLQNISATYDADGNLIKIEEINDERVNVNK